MLPSHGQDTAAVKIRFTGQAVPLIFRIRGAMFLVNRRDLICRVPSLYFWLVSSPGLAQRLGGFKFRSSSN